MKERFLKCFDNVLKCVLDMPPSYEEVSANFVHGKNCSGLMPLRKIEHEQVVSFHGTGNFGSIPSMILVKQRYLECDECHASVRYSGEENSSCKPE